MHHVTQFLCNTASQVCNYIALYTKPGDVIYRKRGTENWVVVFSCSTVFPQTALFAYINMACKTQKFIFFAWLGCDDSWEIYRPTVLCFITRHHFNWDSGTMLAWRANYGTRHFPKHLNKRTPAERHHGHSEHQWAKVILSALHWPFFTSYIASRLPVTMTAKCIRSCSILFAQVHLRDRFLFNFIGPTLALLNITSTK